MKPKTKAVRRSNTTERKMIANLDELAFMQDMFGRMLPALKKDVADGLDAIAIAKKYANLAQARIVSTALTHEDAGLALAASKDILDRAQGKATENKIIKHGMADASEAELDAIIASKLKDVTPAEASDED